MDDDDSNEPRAAPPAEHLLTEALTDFAPPRVDRALVTSLGRGQLALSLAAAHPAMRVDCHFLDIYLADETRRVVPPSLDNLAVHCQPDFPTGPYDLVALPLRAHGDAELTRELLQQGHERLRTGGRLIAATDNPRDNWLHDQLRDLFPRVRCERRATGALYAAEKTAPLRRVRDFASEFAFRDGPRLIRAVSRPGVFSHRQLDLGARALIETMSIHAGDRVLDLGCGAGTVALAAALRAPDVHVVALDSNPRAIECTLRGAALNGLGPNHVEAHVNAEARVEQPGTFDVALANPPYYSHFRIAEIFLRGARAALKPGGRLFLVTKQTPWYLENLGRYFAHVRSHSARRYQILEAD